MDAHEAGPWPAPIESVEPLPAQADPAGGDLPQGRGAVGVAALDRRMRLMFWRKSKAGPRVRRRRHWLWALGLLGGFAWFVLAAAYGAGVYLGAVVDSRLATAEAAADRVDPDWRIDD